PGGTCVTRHPVVLSHVRDPGSDEEHREQHTSEQDDDPFGRGHDPSLANARTVALVETQAFHRRRGPTEADPLLLTATLVDRTSRAGPTTGRSIRPWRERLRRRRGRRPDSSAARPGRRC